MKPRHIGRVGQLLLIIAYHGVAGGDELLRRATRVEIEQDLLLSRCGNSTTAQNRVTATFSKRVQ